MSKIVSITKEMIIDAAFNITKEKGFSKLSNREIAKYLNCSIRPIYYQFKDVEDLNKHLFKKVEEYFYNYLTSDIKYKDKVYLSTGINYIKFAREENNLFKLMFMSDLSVTNFIKEENQSFTEYSKIVVNKTNLDIKKANDMGVICGVTTNPSLIAKEGKVFEEVIAEIASIVDGPISGEVKATTTDAEGMIAEGREIAKIHPNMVVKIPMTVEGLKAVKVLTAEGIKTNVTLIFNANQALLAARAGATYVSPFLGRLDDISTRGVDLISEIAQIFEVAGIDTEIIAASVRNPIHVTDCALAGADIATVPYKVIEQMTHHPLTDAGIEKFQADYKAVFGE